MWKVGNSLHRSVAHLATMFRVIAITTPLLVMLGAGTGHISRVDAAAVAPTVKAEQTKLGDILVDTRGRALYRYTADREDASACAKSCLQLWPVFSPAPGGHPIAGPGVHQNLLSVIVRKDGTKQVTYDGWPLYTYFVDRKPGQTAGQDVKDSLGTWYVVHANPTAKPAP